MALKVFTFFFVAVLWMGFPIKSFASEGRYHHYFAFEGDYVLLKRAHSLNKSLVVPSGSNPNNVVILSSKNLIDDMSFEDGFSAALKVFGGIRSTWELRYLGLFQYLGEKRVDQGTHLGLTLPNNFGTATVDYANASQVQGIYRSSMYTGEANYWHHSTPQYIDYFSVSWLAGLRFFQVREKLKLLFSTQEEGSRYRVRTKNRSFGPQLGFTFECNPYSFFTWGGLIKLGGLFNRGRQSNQWLDQNNESILLNEGHSASNFAYCLEVRPFLEWHPSKFFTFIFHYQVLYLGGVVLSESQLFFHEGGGDQVSSNGDLIYHGATAGIQWNF